MLSKGKGVGRGKRWYRSPQSLLGAAAARLARRWERCEGISAAETSPAPFPATEALGRDGAGAFVLPWDYSNHSDRNAVGMAGAF